MIEVNNIQLDFDITSPSDVLRYKQAGERMEAEGANIALPTVVPDDPGFLDCLCGNAECPVAAFWQLH